MRWYNQFHPSEKNIKKGIWGALYFVLSIILSYNIILSQTVPPLYAKFTQDEKAFAGTVLKSIQNLPEFDSLYTVYKNKYGTRVENEIFAEKIKDERYIFNLKEVLKKNPDSRDIYYNLSSMLKKINGDGDGYFFQAKQIDPELK